jgi:uroporphyrinogen-III synthase
MAEELLLMQTGMKETKVRILSTRPLNESILALAAQQNISIDTRSFIETKSIVDTRIKEQLNELSQRQVAVVFTSMNGAEAVIDCLEDTSLQPKWSIYCMGAATKTLIEQYFTSSSIAATGNNALQLASKVIDAGDEEVIFFCGNQRRDELPTELQKHNISVDEVVVYETIETSVKVDEAYDAILFFSPSAVRSFFAVNNIAANTVLFAIGNTTADEIRTHTENEIIVGDTPAKDGLVLAAIMHFNSLKQS